MQTYPELKFRSSAVVEARGEATTKGASTSELINALSRIPIRNPNPNPNPNRNLNPNPNPNPIPCSKPAS
jgi:hypothetical protein